MDGKTAKVLGDISRRAPKRALTKTVVDTSLEDAARDALKDKNVRGSVDEKRVQRMIEAGHFRRAEEVTDEEAIKEIDDYNTKHVQAAIKSGKIPDPMTDPFFRERMARSQNRDPNKLTSFQSLMAGIRASRNFNPAQDYVLIQLVPNDEKASVIMLPDSAKKKLSIMQAVVFRIGPDTRYGLQEGQRVLVRSYDFDPVTVGDALFMIGKEEHILMIAI